MKALAMTTAVAVALAAVASARSEKDPTKKFLDDCVNDACDFATASKYFLLVQQDNQKNEIQGKNEVFDNLYYEVANPKTKQELMLLGHQTHAQRFQLLANSSCRAISPWISKRADKFDRFCNKNGIEKCVESYLSRDCQCKKLFSGQYCEKCSDECLARGSCQANNDQETVCLCDEVEVSNFHTNETQTVKNNPAWASKNGKFCNHKINYCQKNLKHIHACQHGTCINRRSGQNGYQCRCQA